MGIVRASDDSCNNASARHGACRAAPRASWPSSSPYGRASAISGGTMNQDSLIDRRGRRRVIVLSGYPSPRESQGFKHRLLGFTTPNSVPRSRSLRPSTSKPGFPVCLWYLGGLTAYQRLMLWGFRGDLRHDGADTRWVNYNTSPFSSRSTAS